MGRVKRLNPGDTVVVPVDPNPDEFDITTFVADLSTTLANIAAILLIVDNQTTNHKMKLILPVTVKVNGTLKIGSLGERCFINKRGESRSHFFRQTIT